jgi:hypothetical protein
MSLTLTQLQDRLSAYLAAEAAILGGAQETEVQPGNGARYKMRAADLVQIQTEITNINRQIAALETSSRRSSRVFYVR